VELDDVREPAGREKRGIRAHRGAHDPRRVQVHSSLKRPHGRRCDDTITICLLLLLPRLFVFGLLGSPHARLAVLRDGGNATAVDRSFAVLLPAREARAGNVVDLPVVAREFLNAATARFRSAAVVQDEAARGALQELPA
jgi:hypothetical protein